MSKNDSSVSAKGYKAQINCSSLATGLTHFLEISWIDNDNGVSIFGICKEFLGANYLVTQTPNVAPLLIRIDVDKTMGGRRGRQKQVFVP